MKAFAYGLSVGIFSRIDAARSSLPERSFSMIGSPSRTDPNFMAANWLQDFSERHDLCLGFVRGAFNLALGLDREGGERLYRAAGFPSSRFVCERW